MSWHDDLPLGPGMRALVLGPESAARPLRERGCDVRVVSDPEPLDLPDNSFSVVRIDGPIGTYEWDRWLLQEVQRVLAPGGALRVAVPNLSSLAPPDWGFLASRVSVQLDRTLRSKRGLPARAYPFRGRKYRIDRFLELLSPLGFLDLRCTPHAGGPAPGVRRFEVSATGGPSRFGVSEARPYPAESSHRQAYERAAAPFFAVRSRWAAAHAALCVPPRPIDPAEFAGLDVLVLAPHPDDEIIGCGGTLARAIAAGARVTSLQATDGCEGAALREVPEPARRQIRLAEAQRVSDAVGFSETVYWRADNARFRITDELVDRMKQLLDRVRPVAVFTPFVADTHPDHFTLNRIFARAVADRAWAGRVFQYEVWGLVPATAWCDVTSMSAKLESLLRLYRTAMKVDDFVHFCEDRNLHHAYEHTGRAGLAEAFLETSAAAFAEVVERDGGPS